jgi:VPDSG-CTERM motif
MKASSSFKIFKFNVTNSGLAVVAALTFLLLVPAQQAHATSITTLFNTGVNATGEPLSDGTIGDPHYSLITAPPSSTLDIRVRTSAGGFPIPPWVGDDSVSAWIGPNNDAQVDGPVGSYDYRITFDLSGLNPSTAFISGLWATDNEGLDILLNGQSTGNKSVGFTAFTSFSIPPGSLFVSGLNTLDFLVHNDGGNTGLRVEMTGQASPMGVPDSSSTSTLLSVSVGALLVACRRMKKEVALVGVNQRCASLGRPANATTFAASGVGSVRQYRSASSGRTTSRYVL